MSILNLFPARIRFVNADGTLTEEALRMLAVVVDRVGGVLGDVGADVFAAPDTSPSDGGPVVTQSLLVDTGTPETVMQPAHGGNLPADVVQQPLDYSAGTGLSLMNMRFLLKDTAVTPGAYGDANNVGQFTVDQQGRITGATSVPIAFPSGANFSGSFTGKTVTVANGIITSVV
jgi:hypothetical protein